MLIHLYPGFYQLLRHDIILMTASFKLKLPLNIPEFMGKHPQVFRAFQFCQINLQRLCKYHDSVTGKMSWKSTSKPDDRYLSINNHNKSVAKSFLIPMICTYNMCACISFNKHICLLQQKALFPCDVIEIQKQNALFIHWFVLQKTVKGHPILNSLS